MVRLEPTLGRVADPLPDSLFFFFMTTQLWVPDPLRCSKGPCVD
jgi:hypothetical protein